MVDAALVLAAFAATIVLGFLGQVFFRLTKISDILLLMAFGMAMAWFLDAVEPEPFRVLAPVVGTFALLIILFEGGLDLRVRELFSGLGRAAVLALVGFALSVAAVAAVAYWWFSLPPLTSILLGTILGGASSIAVMPIVRGLAVHPKTRVVLSVESALTDVLCVVGALTLIDIIVLGTQPEVENVGREIGASFAIALGIGLVIGPVWLKALDLLRNFGNVYMLTVAAIFVLFLGTEELGGTGAIAVLVFGVILGNAGTMRGMLGLHGHGFGRDLRQFQSEVAFVVRAFFFVYLGLIFEVSLVTMDLVVGSLVLVGALMVARGVTVFVSAAGSKAMRPDRGVWWALMPRGLAAAVLAGIPAAEGVEGSASFVAYATLVIVWTNLLGSVAGLFVRKRRPAEVTAEITLEDQPELYRTFDERVNRPPSPERAPGPADEEGPSGPSRSSAAGRATAEGTPSRSAPRPRPSARSQGPPRSGARGPPSPPSESGRRRPREPRS